MVDFPFEIFSYQNFPTYLAFYKVRLENMNGTFSK